MTKYRVKIDNVLLLNLFAIDKTASNSDDSFALFQIVSLH